MVLSNGMAKTSHWAALYFVALMTFGNYVLFNLLVAILVEGFSSERNERREREQREIARRKMSCILDASSAENSSSRSLSSSGSSYVQVSTFCRGPRNILLALFRTCERTAGDRPKNYAKQNCATWILWWNPRLIYVNVEKEVSWGKRRCWKSATVWSRNATYKRNPTCWGILRDK